LKTQFYKGDSLGSAILVFANGHARKRIKTRSIWQVFVK